MTTTPESPQTQAALKLPELLAELPEFNLKRFGETDFLIFEGQPFTNAQLADKARRLATGLQAQGLKVGDRVLVMMVNSPEVVISLQAIARVGGVIVPLLPVLKAAEIQHIAANCHPSAVITNLPLATMIKPALEAANLPKPAIIIAVGNPDEAKTAGLISFSELITSHEPLTTLPEVQPGDLAVIIYTSGTTGKPKGVMLSHNNLLFTWNSGQIPEHVSGTNPRESEPVLAALPLAHVFGLAVMNVSFLNGDKLILMPRFELPKAFELIEKYKIAKAAAVPAMLLAMLGHPDSTKYDTSSLKFVVSGAAPLPESVLKGFEQKFGATIREGYGLSESTVSVSGHMEGLTIRPGSVGKPNPGVEVRIADNEGNTLDTGERGEILVRGNNVMMGYYQNPAATATTITDGWLHTGDVGYFDEEGYLYIVERKKDLIIRGGQNIYPRDVEEVLMAHPAVLEVAVVGLPSEKYGEEVKAFVASRPGQTTTAEELIEHCQKFMADYKAPAYVQFLEALPRNTVGKILKTALRDMR